MTTTHLVKVFNFAVQKNTGESSELKKENKRWFNMLNLVKHISRHTKLLTKKIIEVSLDRSSVGQPTTQLVEELTRHMVLEVIFADVDFSFSS